MAKYESLLLIDDDPIAVDIIKDMTESLFDVVHTAYSGEDALKFLKSNTVSIILTDVTMPNMTGDMFVAKLRLVGNNTPVVFLTGNPTLEVAISALELGAVGFLEKPVGKEALQKTLDLTLEMETHRRNIVVLEGEENCDVSLLRSEKSSLGIKQLARSIKKLA